MPAPEPGLALIEYRVAAVEEAIVKIGSAMEAIARMEERHHEIRAAQDRAFKAIHELTGAVSALKDAHDGRLRVIETAMPGLRESASWVKRAALGVLAAIGAALLGWVLRGGTASAAVAAVAA